MFFPGGGGQRTYVANRPTDGTAVTGTHYNQISNTTSYGSEQGTMYGQHIVQSRDGKFVGIVSPYYYYWAGINAMFIDMEGTTVGASNTYQNSSSSVSGVVLPYRDTDLMVSVMNNGYTSGGGGPNFTRMFNKQKTASTGNTTVLQASFDGTRPGMFDGSNTTNYPILFAVTDYGSLKYQTNSKATQPFNDKINTGA